MSDSPSLSRASLLSDRRTFALASLVVLVLITSVYWQVMAAGFAWDDYKFLLDSGWMTDASRWLHIVLHGFPEWASYYRPLGVALFIVETNAFDFSPMPMHLLSLGIHLFNTILVGMLARSLLRRCADAGAMDRMATIGFPCLAMLIYGVHPALVEPVVWISAQFDMLTTCFILLGLVLNMRLRGTVARAASVGLCFFLAACAKEAALSFPFLLLIMDWMGATSAPAADRNESVRAASPRFAFLSRQWPVYLAVLAAGIVYLGLRAWGLGFLVNPGTKVSWSFWPQLQTICFTYMAYWKLIVWPMSDLAPIHDVAVEQFAKFSPKMLAIDAAALAIGCLGLWSLWKRWILGGVIACVTAALLPVLHLVPHEFAASLYHNRYAMTAIATACAFLPSACHAAWLRARTIRIARIAALVVVGWLALAAINTRICIPLWSSDTSLWQWALLENPGSVLAQQSLLAAYMRDNDYSRARPLAEAMMRGEARSCFGCMLNIAALHIAAGDAEAASSALKQAKEDMVGSTTRNSYLRGFMLLSGQLAELQHDGAEAEEAYRAAIAFEPQLPEGYMRMAILLARAQEFDEARRFYEIALPLYAPAERARIKRQFDSLFAPPGSAASKDK